MEVKEAIKEKEATGVKEVIGAIGAIRRSKIENPLHSHERVSASTEVCERLYIKGLV